MEGLTKEDVLALRLEIAELRREMAELRREIAARGVQSIEERTVGDAETSATRCVDALAGGEGSGPYNKNASKDEVSTEQIMTEWIEGEDAWKAKEK